MAQQQDQEGFQEGSRWIHKPPTGEAVAKWFTENVTLHDGMEHAPYLPGLTLIPATEKIKKRVTNAQGKSTLVEEYRQVFTPYARVDTRVAYFWRLCQINGWFGAIEPGPAPRQDALPPGFYFIVAKTAEGRDVRQLACTKQVRVYEPHLRYGQPGRLIMEPPAATKVVAGGSDINTFLRAETGAVGRALGMAGMLIIPGSGVATAEDMQEFLGTASPEGAQLPEDTPAEAEPPLDPAALVRDLMTQLESDFPGKHEEMQAWAKERKFNLNDLTPESPAMRSTLRMAEKKLAEGKAEQQDREGLPPPGGE